MSLLVVGALHWDVVVDAPGLPRLDETLRGDAVEYRFGGKGGNQAMAAARAGAGVAFAGRVGRDAPGTQMRDRLAEAGIDISALQDGPGTSGMSVAISVPGGDYGAVIVSGENQRFDLGAFKVPDTCRVVLAQNEMAEGVLETVAAKARASGAQMWVNLAPAGPIAPGLADVLIVNRVEAFDLLEQPVHDGMMAARALARAHPATDILVTLGGEGVAVQPRDAAGFAAPAPRVEIVSTHGAGDVFVGTLAAARLDGLDWAGAVDMAQLAAARHVSAPRQSP